MFEYYLAGSFDGEGSLIPRFIPDKRYVNGFQIREHINITRKNLEILEMIHKKLRMEKIYFHKRDKL
jgi:intein-encoded DNA endonuclease-like protein